MRTFSEIIDIVVATAKVPHKLPYVVVTTNGIIADLATNHASDWDLCEVRLTPYGTPSLYNHKCEWQTTGCQWTVPCDFAGIRAVKYNGCQFIPRKPPGLVQKNFDHYWYQAGSYVFFTGSPDCVDIAYYKIPPTFTYWDPKMRKIKSDQSCGYLVRANCEPTTPWLEINYDFPAHYAAFVEQVHWVIREYFDVVVNGTLATLYNGEGEIAKGARYFQQYQLGKSRISRVRAHNLEAEV